MAGLFSNDNTESLAASARNALQRIDEVIETQQAYENEVVELYKRIQLLRKRKCAKSYPLVRIGPGNYRTPTGGSKRGTASNLQIAADSGASAKIKTRSGEYDAQECYERALASTGVNTQSDAFKDLVYAAYKAWLHEDISEKSLSEWEEIRDSIAQAIKDLTPEKTGLFSRLFGEGGSASYSARATLSMLDVDHIATNMDYWPEYSAHHMDSRDGVYASFISGGEKRDNVLGRIERLAGSLELESADPRPFSSEEAQKTLNELQELTEVPTSISAARETVGQTVLAAIDSLRESCINAQLAETPINELGKAKTGAQIKKLQDDGIDTLCDLHLRMSSPEGGNLPGIGPKTLPAVKAFLDPIVARLEKDWRIDLDPDHRTEETLLVVRALQAYFSLDELHTEAKQTLKKMGSLGPKETDDLLFATDQIDWLLADDDHIKAATKAMNAARKLIDSNESNQLRAPLRRKKLERLTTDLVGEQKAWKALRLHPDQFKDAIEKFAPGATAPIEHQTMVEPARDTKPVTASTPTKTSGKSKRAKKSSKKAPVAKQRGAARPSWCSVNVPDTLAAGEGLALFYPPLEYIDSSAVPAKPIAADDAPRAQGTHFSCAIPDGWTTAANQDRSEFTLMPSETSSNGPEASISISYDPQIDSGNDAEFFSFAERGTSSFIWGNRYISECIHPHGRIEMHEAAGRNCRCTVMQMATEDDCLVYHIYPYSLTGADFLNVRFGKPSTCTPKEAQAFVDSLARTIEIKEPTVPQRLESLDERFLEAQSLSEAKYSGMSLLLTELWTYFEGTYEQGKDYCKTIRPNATKKEQEIAGICACTQYLDTCVPHVEHCIDLVQQWLEDHTARNMDILIAWDIIETMERFVLTPERFESPFIRKELADLLKPTPMQLALLEKLESLKALVEKLDIEDPGDEEPATHDGSDGEQAGADNAAAPSSDLRQEPQMDFPTFMLTFLSSGWFYFEEKDISWNESSHSIEHLEINGLKLGAILAHIKEFNAGFDSIDEVTQYFVAFMNALEQDDQLRVPRKFIASGVQKALPKGDLTGITLANLCAANGAIIVRGGWESYQVFFDNRLSSGIPQFFNLVARMLWDLRSIVNSLENQPFTIAFLSTRNFDADARLGKVNKPVAGAQEYQMAMSVSEPPSIDLSACSATKPKRRKKPTRLEEATEEDLESMTGEEMAQLLRNSYEAEKNEKKRSK